MQVVSRASGAGRRYRYVCATYWNRGASICANGVTLDMRVTDSAVRTLLAAEVLRPEVVEKVMRRALVLLEDSEDATLRETTLTKRLAVLEAELANLSDAAARSGGVPAVLQALQQRDDERQQVVAQLSRLQVARK